KAEPVSIQGRQFTRYLGEDVPANAVLRVDGPTGTDASQQQHYLIIVAIALGLLMLGALGIVLARRRAPAPAIVGQPGPALGDDAERLAREIAALDAQFELEQNPSDDARATYAEQRDALKRSLASALDAQKHGA